MPEQKKKQEAYATYQNYTNKTLWTVLDNVDISEVEVEVIKMILEGRKK